MRTYIFLVLAALASIAACQRFEIPQVRGRSFAPQEEVQVRRRLRPRPPPPRQPTLNDFTDIRSRPRPRPSPVQSPRPAPIDTSSILQQAIAKHRPRPPPAEPQPIQNVRPAPPPQKPTFGPPSPDNFEPTTFKSTGPRPLPLNLDKILQIPRIESEAAAPDSGSPGSLRPSLPPLGNTFPRKESHFDEALRQVLESPAPSPNPNTFRIPPRSHTKPSNPSPFQNPHSPPRFAPPRLFSEPSPSAPPAPSPTEPAPRPQPGPRPKPIRIEDAFDLSSFQPAKPSKPSRPLPVVKVARPPRPVQTQSFVPSVQTLSRSPPSSRQQQQEFVSRNQSPQRQSPQFISRTPASRRPAERPEFLPEQTSFAVNENQHISLVKEEQLAERPIDFQDAKLRNDPVKVITNYMHRNEDGTFTWGYEGEDGSFKEETRGKDCIVRGRYGYVDPTGVKREFTYESGNPCDPEAIAKQKEAAAEGFYDYDKGVYITAEGKEVPLNIKANRRRQ